MAVRTKMRRIASSILLLLLAAVVAAPLLTAGARPEALGIYAAFSWVCHQRPERCWQLAGFPLAVCVRCLGLYAGALAGALAGLRFSRPAFLVSAGLLGLEWGAEAAGFTAPQPVARLAVGLLAGFFAVSALLTERRRSATRSSWIGGAIRQ